jgi:hypothetical protein
LDDRGDVFAVVELEDVAGLDDGPASSASDELDTRIERGDGA